MSPEMAMLWTEGVKGAVMCALFVFIFLMWIFR